MQGSSEGQIKKHYKRLSLTQHPDKRKPDSAKNETLDSINDHWVEVTKAFKALTDADVKYNYEHYGHPDGKQSFSIGIALPLFIITNGNGKYVLLLYAALLAVALPLLVGKWWYGTQRLTKDKILISSASKLFRDYKNDLDTGGVIGALSSGDEFQESLKTDKDDEISSKVESKLIKVQEDSKKGMSKQERERLLNMDDEKRRKILGLLWAYLYRIDLKDPKLDERMLIFCTRHRDLLIFTRKIRGCSNCLPPERSFAINVTCVRQYGATVCFVQCFTTPHPSYASWILASPSIASFHTEGHSRS